MPRRKAMPLNSQGNPLRKARTKLGTSARRRFVKDHPDWTGDQLAHYAGCTRRTIVNDQIWWKYQQLGETSGEETLVGYRELGGPPKKLEELAEDVLSCVVDSPEGFRDFFVRFSPYSYMPNHVFWTFQAAFDYERGDWKDQIVENAPVRHAKSETWSIWYPLFRMIVGRLQQKPCRILLLSKSHQLAERFAQAIANEMETNEDMILSFGRMKPEESEGIWRPGNGLVDMCGKDRRMKEPSLQVRGAKETIFGNACDWLIGDDVVTRANSMTNDARNELEDWFMQEAYSRLEVEGHVVMLGARFHQDDLYGRLTSKRYDEDTEEEKPMWEHIKFPALRDPHSGEPSLAEDAIPLWPERWGRGILMRKLKNTGTSIFSATYQQSPVGAGSALAKLEWFMGSPSDTRHDKGCLDRLRSYGNSFLKPDGYARAIGFDPSGGSGYAALVVADVQLNTPDFHAVVLEVWREKGAGINRVLQKLEQIANDYHPQFLVSERNLLRATEDMRFFEPWSRMHGVRLVEHTTGYSNKMVSDVGIEGLARSFEFGWIRLPYPSGGTPEAFESRQQTQTVITEATEYVPELGTKSAKSIDTLMALWFLLNKYRSFYVVKPAARLRQGFSHPVRLDKAQWARH